MYILLARYCPELSSCRLSAPRLSLELEALRGPGARLDALLCETAPEPGARAALLTGYGPKAVAGPNRAELVFDHAVFGSRDLVRPLEKFHNLRGAL